MRVALLTREYPPDVYGGAGVHVEYLARELSGLEEVTVHAWGAGDVRHYPWEALGGDDPSLAALRALSIDLTMAARTGDADLVHSHTWYANLGRASVQARARDPARGHGSQPRAVAPVEGRAARRRLRDLELLAEKTALEAADAVIAVSRGTRDDILNVYPAIDPERVRVIYNGIDTEQYAPDAHTDVLDRFGVDAERPSVVFVGRITRQKGVEYLLRAARAFDPAAQLVLCAGSADTPELGAEVERRVTELRAERDGVVWLEQMLPKVDVIQLLSHATVFACPSIYEPLGIVNLEAMACEAAVVATATGGIVEVVEDGDTGLLVPIDPGDDRTGAPRDPDRFAGDFAERVNALIADPGRAATMGRAGRRRAIEQFSWPMIAGETSELYRSLV